MKNLLSQFPVHIYDHPGAAALNRELMASYLKQVRADSVRRSHFFEGRYENVYIDQRHLPAIQPVLHAVGRAAAQICGLNPDQLRTGFWFNDMAPASRTLAHTHDDDDELLSCVYYVNVPPNSGCLVAEAEGHRTVIRPLEGRMVFFRPDVLHWVTPNLSPENRLSIGINVGMYVGSGG